MLLGKRLGRRHQRRLMAGLERRAASRTGRTTVLPEPTSPISSRCIGGLGGEVGVELGERRSAGRRSARREASRASASASPSAAAAPIGIERRASRLPRRRSASATWCRKSSSKASRSARRVAASAVGRKVDRAQRVGDPGRAGAARATRRRQRLDRHRRRLDRLPGPLAQPARRAGARTRGATGTRPVVWMPPAAPPRLVEDLVRLDPEAAAALERAAEQDPGPGTQPLGEPGLVEPGRLQRAAGVGGGRLDDPQVAPPGRPHAGAAHLDQHRRALADPKLAHLAHRRAVAIGARDPEQQVADGLDPELGCRRRQLRAGAPQGGQRRAEQAWPRAAAQRRRSQRLDRLRGAACERPRRRRGRASLRDGRLDHPRQG